jgi:hypothetical protein
VADMCGWLAVVGIVVGLVLWHRSYTKSLEDMAWAPFEREQSRSSETGEPKSDGLDSIGPGSSPQGST